MMSDIEKYKADLKEIAELRLAALDACDNIRYQQRIFNPKLDDQLLEVGGLIRDWKLAVEFFHETWWYHRLTPGRWCYPLDGQWLVSDLEPQRFSSGCICRHERRAYDILDPEFVPPVDGQAFKIPQSTTV